MGLSFRKSVSVGPIRFNLSKSGVGISTGIKGLRFGTGPRGNHVRMGLGGISYSKTFSNKGQPTSRPSNQHSVEAPVPGYGENVLMSAIDSADVSSMAHSSSTDLIQELNEKKRILRWGPAVAVVSVLLLLVQLVNATDSSLILVTSLIFGTATFLAFRRDALVKSTVILYDLDDTFEQAYTAIHSAAEMLAQCDRCWHISAAGKVHNRKYHAGASSLVERKITSVSITSPDFLKTNVDTVAVEVGVQTLYFFPDRMLVFDRGKVGAVGYDELGLKVSSTRFIEDDSLPRDANVVDYTWKFVNKKGGPDRRFANNRQLPICVYEELHFYSSSGLNEVLQASRCGTGDYLQKCIQYLSHLLANKY